MIGPVASGKSTLLMGILGETEPHQTRGGAVKIRQPTINHGFAYVGQEYWLRRGSIRENILCESAYDEELYRKVLVSTALEPDIEVVLKKIE